MADLSNFLNNEVEPRITSFEPIPAGKYLAMIVDSQIRQTRRGDGRYLQLTFQILEGSHKGRLVWARLNLENPNPTAVRIARAELAAICRAVGVPAPKDSVELHNLPLVIQVECRKRDNGEVRNEIRGYFKKEASATQQQTTSNPPSWRR